MNTSRRTFLTGSATSLVAVGVARVVPLGTIERPHEAVSIWLSNYTYDMWCIGECGPVELVDGVVRGPRKFVWTNDTGRVVEFYEIFVKYRDMKSRVYPWGQTYVGEIVPPDTDLTITWHQDGIAALS